MVKKLWRYVKPFPYNTSVSRTDGQTGRRTDGRTDRIAISISRVSVLTRDKNCGALHGPYYKEGGKAQAYTNPLSVLFRCDASTFVVNKRIIRNYVTSLIVVTVQEQDAEIIRQVTLVQHHCHYRSAHPSIIIIISCRRSRASCSPTSSAERCSPSSTRRADPTKKCRRWSPSSSVSKCRQSPTSSWTLDADRRRSIATTRSRRPPPQRAARSPPPWNLPLPTPASTGNQHSWPPLMKHRPRTATSRQRTSHRLPTGMHAPAVNRQLKMREIEGWEWYADRPTP